MPAKDKDVFHNYVHVWKQLILCDVSEAITVDRHLFCKFLTFL